MCHFQRVFLEGNPYLLAITMVVSLLHSVFDFLAFKNGQSLFFWYHVLTCFFWFWGSITAHLMLCQQIFNFGTKISPWKDCLQSLLLWASYVSSLSFSIYLTMILPGWFLQVLELACVLNSGKLEKPCILRYQIPF